MAKGYLEKSTKNIAEVSLEVGYDNALYFSRLFRKSTGMTPTEYRKRKKAIKRSSPRSLFGSEGLFFMYL